MSEALSVVRIEDLAALDQFEMSWNSIAQSTEWPFAELHWNLAAARHLEANRETCALVVLKNGELTGALFVTAGTTNNNRFLCPTGFSALGESTVILANDPESESCLVSELVQRRLPFVLPRILRSHRLPEVLRDLVRRKGILLERPSSGSPVLYLEEGVEAVWKSLSAKRRNSLKRKLKRLKRMGTVEFQFEYPSVDDVAGYLKTFAVLEEAGWKGREGSAVLKRPGFYDFFSAGLREFARTRRVRFDSILLDDKVVAIQMGLESHGRYYLIKPTYDETLAALSPGLLLTHAAIAHSAEKGLRSYEFLGAEDEWKLIWADSVHPTRTWVFYPYSYCGLSALTNDVGRKLFSRFRYWI